MSSRDGWERSTYRTLAARSLGASSQLQDRGVAPGSVVPIVGVGGGQFLAAFFGVLHAGCTPSPLPPPGPFAARDAYVDHIARILDACDPALVVTDPACRQHVDDALGRAGSTSAVVELDDVEVTEARRRPLAPIGLLQFTSGSSGTPRGVRVSPEHLAANISMIRRWLRMTADDATATWLPVFHDMGLIGCLLTPTVVQSDVWLMSPDQFVRRPLRWLECFGREGAVLTAAPTFGYAHLARAAAKADLSGMDFSAWRAAIVGAERVDPVPLATLARVLGPYGFRPETYLPAYGLAEATLAVTGSPLGVTPTCARPAWSELRLGAPVAVTGRSRLGERSSSDDGGWLTGCGPPLDGAAVRVEDEQGCDLGDGHLGEIVVTSPSVTAGYHGGADGSQTSFDDDGALRTGDAGFLLDGELFVVGRIGDSIKARGRTVYAEDIEAKLVAEAGVPSARCAVVPGLDEAGGLVVVVESARPPWDAVTQVLVRELGADQSVELLAVPRNSIPRTSSGKPRRRVLWHQLVEGQLRRSS